MARSLNKVQLIGNLTRDPELRYTPNGAAVCSFSIATNRAWTTDTGEKREEVDFHRIIAWNKLGELCSQFLIKGRKVYVEGRLTTRSWTGQDGAQKSTTEVVINDMILLDNKGREAATGESHESPASTSNAAEAKVTAASAESSSEPKEETHEEPKVAKKSVKKEAKDEEEGASAASAKSSAPMEEEVMPDDIPF